MPKTPKNIKKSSSNPKTTDAQFKEALLANAGLITQTWRYLVKKYEVDITYQSVSSRAKGKKWAETLKQARESTKDIAEGVVIQSIKNKSDKRLAYNAAVWYLEKMARERGYSDDAQQDININIGGNGIDASNRNK